jgi:hypothetical protein
MKFTKLPLAVLFFLILLPSGFAHADNFFSSYASFYTVGALNSTVQQTNFNINQQPFLYIKYFDSDPHPSQLSQTNFFFVQNPSMANIFTFNNSTNTNQTWFGFSSSFWNSVKTPGTWTITADSFNTSKPFLGSTNFKINAAPEPVGTILFLIGAFIMGTRILGRKKAIAV